jgi:hypothetical protein
VESYFAWYLTVLLQCVHDYIDVENEFRFRFKIVLISLSSIQTFIWSLEVNIYLFVVIKSILYKENTLSIDYV